MFASSSWYRLLLGWLFRNICRDTRINGTDARRVGLVGYRGRRLSMSLPLLVLILLLPRRSLSLSTSPLSFLNEHAALVELVLVCLFCAKRSEQRFGAAAAAGHTLDLTHHNQTNSSSVWRRRTARNRCVPCCGPTQYQVRKREKNNPSPHPHTYWLDWLDGLEVVRHHHATILVGNRNIQNGGCREHSMEDSSVWCGVESGRGEERSPLLLCGWWTRQLRFDIYLFVCVCRCVYLRCSVCVCVSHDSRHDMVMTTPWCGLCLALWHITNQDCWSVPENKDYIYESLFVWNVIMNWMRRLSGKSISFLPNVFFYSPKYRWKYR